MNMTLLDSYKNQIEEKLIEKRKGIGTFKGSTSIERRLTKSKKGKKNVGVCAGAGPMFNGLFTSIQTINS